MIQPRIALFVSCCVLAASGLAQQPGERPGPPGEAPPRAFAHLPASHGQAFSCPSCNLKGLNLSASDLTNANLTGADITAADLTSVNLGGASLAEANLTGSNLSKAQIGSSSQGHSDFTLANLSGVDFRGAVFGDVDMEYADLSGTDFSGVDLSRVRFGPMMKTGLYNGKKTSFRGAIVSAALELDASTADLTGIRRVKMVPATSHTPKSRGGAPPTEVCGKSDLSVLTSVVYVSAAGTDGAGCGTTHVNACKTIRQGLQNCSASGCGVLVDFGQYPQTATLSLKPGVNLYGGCVPASSPGSYLSLITAPAGGAPAVGAQNVGAATLMENFKVSGSAAVGTTGSASIAMSIASSSALKVNNCEFYASTGGAGAQGPTPGQAAAGGGGSGTTGGGTNACPSTTGGNGSVQETVSLDWWSGTCSPSCSANNCWGYAGYPGTTGGWTSGGKWGSGNCAGAACPASSPGKGNAGATGTTASCGGQGTWSTNITGSFSGGKWSGSVGGAGGGGGNGAGGGGGGAGGYQCGYCFGYIEAAGNTGGGGGAGGCGAVSGPGGQQGGASFAIVSAASALSITNSRIVGNQGGPGGVGGGGAHGGTGGAGAAGASGGKGADGGPGGQGGGGGGGGAAAGGNGGPSFLMALVGSSTVTDTGTVYYLGSSGVPGGGGTGGISPNTTCTGGTGSTGVLGAVAQNQQFQ
jgi:uncharacterized protein YjbI with pentapeptide repeats